MEQLAPFKLLRQGMNSKKLLQSSVETNRKFRIVGNLLPLLVEEELKKPIEFQSAFLFALKSF